MSSSSCIIFNPNFMAFSSAVRLSSTLLRNHLPFPHTRFSSLRFRLSELRLLSTLPLPLTHPRQLTVRRRAYASAREERENEEPNGTLWVNDSNGGRDGRVVPAELHKEATEAYMAYAMSVLLGRALPDVKDGLKPVHRRILGVILMRLEQAGKIQSASLISVTEGEPKDLGTSTTPPTEVEASAMLSRAL